MTEQAPPQTTNARAWFAALPRWKKVLLIVGAAMLLLAGVLAVVEAGQPGPQPTTSTTTGPGGVHTSLLPTGQPDQEAQPGEEPVSAGFFRLGFSLVAGFCIGFALRKTLKLVAIFAGLQLLVLFLLDYSAVAPVDWARIDALWDHLMAAIADEADSFRTFILGRLPAAGLGATGLYAGLKKD